MEAMGSTATCQIDHIEIGIHDSLNQSGKTNESLALLFDVFVSIIDSSHSGDRMVQQAFSNIR